MSRVHHARKLSNSAVGLVFGGCAASLAAFTYFYVRAVSGQSGYYDDADLPPSAGIRGQYVNAGSRDAGPDRSDDNPYIRYRREQQRKADEAAAAAQRQ